MMTPGRLPSQEIPRPVVTSNVVVEESLWAQEQLVSMAVALAAHQRRTEEMVVPEAMVVGTTEAVDRMATGPAGTTALRTAAWPRHPHHHRNNHHQQPRHRQHRGIHREDEISMPLSSDATAMMRTDPIRPFHDQVATLQLGPTTISHHLHRRTRDQLDGHRSLIVRHQGGRTDRMRDPGGEKCPNRPR
jgi:hypothetical protein